MVRTVLDTDPDPLVNTVTATYSGLGTTAIATASATTELFQPGVGVTKDCTPDPVVVGGDVTCEIVVTNDSSDDSPDLTNGTIVDTLTGDLLDPANEAVASSDCTPDLPTGESCTIITELTVLARSRPARKRGTVLYNPDGFPNEITATVSDTVTVVVPSEITVTKTATALSKVGDPVTYTIEICNVDADITLNRDSVLDSLLGDISDEFPDTLAPGECAEFELVRTVLDAILTRSSTPSRPPTQGSARQRSPRPVPPRSCSSPLSASPRTAADPVVVGGVVTCTIVVTNTSSADSPDLINGTIVDSLTGNLLDPANGAVASSGCTPDLQTGGTCTIVTTRTALATRPQPARQHGHGALQPRRVPQRHHRHG